MEATPISLDKSVQQPMNVEQSSRPLVKSEGRGGVNGALFDDVLNSNVSGVRAVNITFNEKQVGSIEVLYLLSNGSLYQAPRHGYPLTSNSLILLDSDEVIEEVEGQTDGNVINQLIFTTRKSTYERNTYGPFGGSGPLSFSFEGYVVGFHGRSGERLNQIGVYSLDFVKRSKAFGEDGGSEFDEHVDVAFPPVVGLSRLFIGHGDRIDSIQPEYLLLGNATVLGEKHGGDFGDLTVVTFDKGEVITAINGMVDMGIVSRLTVFTMKAGGVPVQYGPFGILGTTPFSFKGSILGFHGRSGIYIDRLGFYYI